VNDTDGKSKTPRCRESSGPPPFVTRRVFQRSDGSLTVWHSRHHRKGLVRQEVARAEAVSRLLLRCLWMPAKLNWWIGIVFALGSILFASASVLSLSPALAARFSLEPESINAVFFAGSIPFTVAAYLQLFQAANAPPFSISGDTTGKIRFFGWKPSDIG
jgi:hypothetical protein